MGPFVIYVIYLISLSIYTREGDAPSLPHNLAAYGGYSHG